MNRKYSFMSVLTLLLVIGFLCTSIISYFVARQSLAEQIAGSTLPLTSDNIYSEIKQDLRRPIFISSLMANDTFVRDWVLAGETNPDKMVRYLREIQQRYATVTSFFISDASHHYYHSSGVLKTVSPDDPQDQWYFNMPKAIEDYQINIDRDTADLTSMTVFINHKVYDYAGNYIGTIGVGLGVTSVKELIETYQERYGRTIFFTDQQGQVTLVGSQYQGPDNLKKIPGLASHLSQLLTVPSTSLTFQQENHPYYLNSRLVNDFDWYLIVLEKETPGEIRVQKALIINIAISLGITAIVMIIAGMTIGSYQKKLQAMATTDKLTCLTNRQMFDFLYQQAWKSSLRHNTALSALLIDIDHFKRVNDTYGHPAGDHVLETVARTLKDTIRGDDCLFRWGGEEFLALLSDCNAAQAMILAERLRSRIQNLTISQGKTTLQVTISLGTAELKPDESAEALIARTDQALYRAKSNGRNRAEVAS